MSRTNPPPKRRRRALFTAGVLAATALGTGGMMQGTASAADFACEVDYSANDWGSGFSANLSITNTGSTATNGWTLTYSYSGNQRLSQGWNGQWSQSGQTVTVRDTGWNGAIAPNATVSTGANFTYSGTNAAPTSFSVNGVACGEDGGGGPGGPDPDPPGDRVDNPYENAGVYVNPDWAANARSEPGGAAIADEPTAVWLDRRAAITGGSAGNSTGLREHLDNALVQAQDHENFVFQVVVYNLPGRDCAALASNGELQADEIDVYKEEFIDPIAEILGDPAYADLRIVTIIEIDSLPNLITNVSPRETATPQCDEMLANGNYQEGVSYALSTLGAIPNVYNYVDAGHYGWIGWDDNFTASAELFHETATMNGATVDDVAGFIVNTANYGPSVEPHYSIDDTVAGTSVRQSEWVDWNRYVDNQSFALAFREELVSQGFNSEIGMLIDTSRNGWGGPDRPAGPGPTTDVNAYVEGSRVDGRLQTGNWCNQEGAGLGERPTASPVPNIDAYAWIKPPGESDGSSRYIPNPEGKGFDRMCDPTYEGNARNNYNMSGALPDAPLSGHWFSAQFQELLANAYPPL